VSVHANWSEPRQPYAGPEPSGSSGSRGILLLLASVAGIVLCLTGVLAAKLLQSDTPPPTLPADVGAINVTTAVPQVIGTVPAGTPGQPELEIEPQQGYVGTLITVTGMGWSPGEPVFVFLRTTEGDPAGNYAYAAAVADDRGSFRTALTFPNEARWSGQSVALVAARGSRSGLEASAQFDLVAPSATSTVPLPELPPTQPATATSAASNTPPPTPTSTLTPTPTPTPPPVITDWLGEYFVGLGLAGAPVLARNDTAIDFNWGLGSPGAGVPVDQFSARWTRQLNFREAHYRFTVWADDGIRLWLDGELLIDEWRDGVVEGLAVDRFVPGGWHALRVEYYENAGGAMVRFVLERVQAPTATPSPTLAPAYTDTPTPTPPPTTAPPSQVLPSAWQGEYYANPLLAGDAVLVRTDAEINFDWGQGAPAEGLPSDAFSVRWTGSQWLPTGRYRYSLVADDVARLFIDGQPVLLPQQLRMVTLATVEVSLGEGTHVFVVEYVEISGGASIRLWGEVAASGDASR
jgi:hypothetical protein